MGLRQKIAKRIILAGDPHAFDEGTLLAEVEKQEQRIANDPEAQRIRTMVAADGRRQKLWMFAGSATLTGGLCGASAWFMPGLVTPGMAVFTTCILLSIQWAALRSLP